MKNDTNKGRSAFWSMKSLGNSISRNTSSERKSGSKRKRLLRCKRHSNDSGGLAGAIADRHFPIFLRRLTRTRQRCRFRYSLSGKSALVRGGGMVKLEFWQNLIG